MMLQTLWRRANACAERLPEDLVALVGRLAVGLVFWRSAQTKFTGWEVFGQSLQFFNVSPSTLMLFQYEYRLPLLGYQAAAYAATAAEFLFSLMLILGLCTRLAASGLLAVTAVIQIFVFPDAWPTHILWFALLLYLLKHGGGKLSADWIGAYIHGTRGDGFQHLPSPHR